MTRTTSPSRRRSYSKSPLWRRRLGGSRPRLSQSIRWEEIHASYFRRVSVLAKSSFSKNVCVVAFLERRGRCPVSLVRGGTRQEVRKIATHEHDGLNEDEDSWFDSSLPADRPVNGRAPHLAAEILLGRWQIGGQTDFGGGPVEGAVDGCQVQAFRQRGKGVA